MAQVVTQPCRHHQQDACQASSSLALHVLMYLLPSTTSCMTATAAIVWNHRDHHKAAASCVAKCHLYAQPCWLSGMVKQGCLGSIK
jgi:hypothetical protein